MLKSFRGWAVVVSALLGLSACYLTRGIEEVEEPSIKKVEPIRLDEKMDPPDDESPAGEIIDSLRPLAPEHDLPTSGTDSALAQPDRVQETDPVEEETRDKGQPAELHESPDSRNPVVSPPDSGDQAADTTISEDDPPSAEPSEADSSDAIDAVGSPTEASDELNARVVTSPHDGSNLGWIAGIVGVAAVVSAALLYYNRAIRRRRHEQADHDMQPEPLPPTGVRGAPSASTEGMPSPPDGEGAEHALQSLAKEAWRLERVCDRMLAKLPPTEQRRYAGRLRWFRKQLDSSLEEVGMRVVSIEGQEFDIGTAATPLNAEDFGPDDKLVVDTMVEPIIMGPNGILQDGTVTLRKAQP